MNAATAVDPAEIAGWPDAHLTGEVRRVLREVARLEAWRAELIGEAERRDLARRDGFASTTAWLMAVLCRRHHRIAHDHQPYHERK